MLVYLYLLWLCFISLFVYRKKRKQNAGKQYTCSKGTVLSEQNNDIAATAELSSPTVTQIPIETEDDVSDLIQSGSSQMLNKSIVNLVNIETNQENVFFLMNIWILKSLINQICVCRSKGLSLQFSIECNDCDWTYKFFSSPEFKCQEKYSRGQK